MTKPTDEPIPQLHAYLARYDSFPRQSSVQRRHPMSVDNLSTERSRRHPQVLEVALTLGTAGVLFALLASVYVVAHSAHPAGQSQSVGAAGTATTAAASTAATAATPTCTALSTPVKYNVYQLDSPGSASPAVSCAQAAALAEAWCPLNMRPCVGTPLPDTAQLSLIKDFPGSNVADPARLVWAVTWNLATCSLPKATTTSPSPPGGMIIAAGNVPGCRWVTFVDASTGNELFASMQTHNTPG